VDERAQRVGLLCRAHRFGIEALTGVRPWFKTFTVEYDFTFAGIGKKGGY